MGVPLGEQGEAGSPLSPISWAPCGSELCWMERKMERGSVPSSESRTRASLQTPATLHSSAKWYPSRSPCPEQSLATTRRKSRPPSPSPSLGPGSSLGKPAHEPIHAQLEVFELQLRVLHVGPGDGHNRPTDVGVDASRRRDVGFCLRGAARQPRVRDGAHGVCKRGEPGAVCLIHGASVSALGAAARAPMSRRTSLSARRQE